MPDNVNITVNETIENVVVNPSVTTEVIDVNISSTTEEINIDITPNLTTININTIPGGFYVPYTGATQDVNLGEFDITAAHLIKDGGQASQFLKADGSVDNNIYLTSADLPSTLDLYATTTASDVSGYTVLVRNISDSRFNTTAVDVSTGVITTTAQLVGSLVSDANIISGNPGIFNITTIGNISRTSGTGQAEFFFRVYKRDNLGVETFITESSKTLPVTNGGYVEFSAVALWNDGVFLDTDRVVLKYYADRLTSPVGSNPVYKFQFGGISPVRSTAAIPVAVLPNIYLRDLADVENVDALNNEVLYWNDADSLWEHSLVINLLSPASSTVNGYLTSTDWTAFNGKFNLPSLTSGSVLFSNGTTIAQDNTNFFWDDTNNRLGIGTTTPTANLHIKGISTLNTDLALRVETSAAGMLLQVDNGGFTRVSGPTARLYVNVASAGFGARLVVAGNAHFSTSGTGNAGAFLIDQGGTSSASRTIWYDETGGIKNLIQGKGTSYITSGNTLFNNTTDQGGIVQIKAPGALSTDIALRVRNSADTSNIFTVQGDGNIQLGPINTSKNIFFGESSTDSARITSNGYQMLIGSRANQPLSLNIGAVTQLFISNLGNIGIGNGTTAPVASAQLDVQSTTKGFLPPRMTNAQRIAIATPAVGLCVYCTDAIEGLYINKSTGWTFIG